MSNNNKVFIYFSNLSVWYWSWKSLPVWTQIVKCQVKIYSNVEKAKKKTYWFFFQLGNEKALRRHTDFDFWESWGRLSWRGVLNWVALKIEWALLNGITMVQKKSDPINRIIPITGLFLYSISQQMGLRKSDPKKGLTINCNPIRWRPL